MSAAGLGEAEPAGSSHGGWYGVRTCGPCRAHARRHDHRLLIVVAGRLFASLGIDAGELPIRDVWTETQADLSLLDARRRPVAVLRGTTFDVDPQVALPLAQLLAHFPVAVLYGEAARGPP